MADRPSESKNVVPNTKRGGAMGAPLHVAQMAVATLLLLASAYFLLLHNWVIGFVLLIIALPLCIIAIRR